MDKLIIGARIFERLDACDYGDYGRNDALGLANVEALSEQFSDRMMTDHYSEYSADGTPSQIYRISSQTWIDRPLSDYENVDLIILEGSYGNKSAYLATDCEEYSDIVAGLENYPVIDEDILLRIEMEWKDEAVETAVSDMHRELRKHGGRAEDIWQEMSQEQCETMIRDAMEKTNTYAESELSGSYLDLDRIAPHIAEVLNALPIVEAVTLPDGASVALGEREYPYDYTLGQINETLNYGTDAQIRTILESIANTLHSGE